MKKHQIPGGAYSVRHRAGSVYQLERQDGRRVGVGILVAAVARLQSEQCRGREHQRVPEQQRCQQQPSVGSPRFLAGFIGHLTSSNLKSKG